MVGGKVLIIIKQPTSLRQAKEKGTDEISQTVESQKITSYSIISLALKNSVLCPCFNKSTFFRSQLNAYFHKCQKSKIFETLL